MKSYFWCRVLVCSIRGDLVVSACTYQEVLVSIANIDSIACQLLGHRLTEGSGHRRHRGDSRHRGNTGDSGHRGDSGHKGDSRHRRQWTQETANTEETANTQKIGHTEDRGQPAESLEQAGCVCLF